VVIPPFVFIIFSLVIGLWVMSTKSHNILNKLFPFKPYGSFLYLSLAIITTSFIGYAYLNANDALLRFIEISFLYIHFGIGLMFFIYTLFNFWTIFEKKMDVYKIFYQPNIFSMFYVNLISGLFIIAFSTFGGISMHKNALSGYNTSIGDAYSANNENILAEGFYLNSIKHVKVALKPNYALANLYQSLQQENDEFQALQRCLFLNPTPAVYARLNAFYQRHDQYFPSMFMLQDGLKKYPNNQTLLVNYGYLFAKKSIYDSAIYYFEKALNKHKDEVAATNLLSIYAQTRQVEKYDNLISNYSTFQSVPYLSNVIGGNILLSKKSEYPLLENIQKDSILDGNNYTYLYNYALSKLSNPDTSLSKILVRYIQQPKNEDYKESLIYLKGIYDYYSSTKVIDGIQDLMYLVEQHNNVHYIEFLGNMQLKSGMYKEAYETYSKLLINPTQKLLLQKCMTAQLIGAEKNVYTTVEELSTSKDSIIGNQAKSLLIAQQPFNKITWSDLSDQQKNEIFYYKRNKITVDEFKTLVSQIKDPQLSALTFVQYIETCINKNETSTALAIWNAMPKSEDTHEAIITEGNIQYLRLLVQLGDAQSIESELKVTKLPENKKGYIDYFKGIATWIQKDSSKALTYLKQAVDKVGYKEEVCNAYIRLEEAKSGSYKTLDDLNHIKLTHVYSTKLSLTYLDMCLDLGFSSSAESEYNRMRNYYSEEENKLALEIVSRAGVINIQ
jgi:tetratricopeptide (TPR) repeat protein